MQELESVLNGEEPEVTEEVTETPAEPEQATTEEQPEQATGEEETDSTPEPEPPKAAEPDVEHLRREVEAYKQAAIDERRKRQAMAEEQEKPDFWSNPEEVLSGMEQRFQGQLQSMRVDTSETIARSRYDDFDQMRDKFIEMSQSNPALIQQMYASNDPAGYAYETARTETERQEFGSINEFKDATRAKLEAELEAKYQARLAEELAKRDALPGSASDKRAAGAATSNFSGPQSLNEIFGD